MARILWIGQNIQYMLPITVLFALCDEYLCKIIANLYKIHRILAIRKASNFRPRLAYAISHQDS